MKQPQSRLGEKSIETPYLHIKNNIMTWSDTMIQLSNVSYISASDIDPIRFPLLALGMIILGLILFSNNAFVSIILIAAGVIWLYLWYRANEKRKEGAMLTIRMNSGHNLYFSFENKEFLKRVVTVLERIIIDGGANNVSINIRDCQISGSASVLNNLRT